MTFIGPSQREQTMTSTANTRFSNAAQSRRYADRGGDGKTTPTGKPDGSFGLDFEYVAGSGDLDEFGGRTGVTPEFPQGTYYYVMTEEYPFIPRKFKGTPDPSFSKQKMDPHANLGGQGGPGAKGGKKGKKGPPPGGFGGPPEGFPK